MDHGHEDACHPAAGWLAHEAGEKAEPEAAVMIYDGPDIHPVFDCTVYGTPAPQGSKRHVGGGRMIESSKNLPPWREAVKQAALREIEMAREYVPGGFTALDGPVAASFVFTLRKPASAPKRRRTYPDRTPDLSKLARGVEDALVDAGVLIDDARIVEYWTLAKVFPCDGGRMSMSTPGCRIQLWRVGDA